MGEAERTGMPMRLRPTVALGHKAGCNSPRYGRGPHTAHKIMPCSEANGLTDDST